MRNAARRVARGLIALPRQVVTVVRPDAGSWATMFERPSSVGATSRGGQAIGLVFALVANIAAVVLVFAFGRAVWYPFWAAGASSAELERSWGGPGAFGATLVHWLVAAATIVVTYLLILSMERLTERGGAVSSATTPRSRRR